LARNTTFGTIWKQVLILSVDPHPDIAQDAGIIVDYIHLALLESPMSALADKIRIEILDLTSRMSQRYQVQDRSETKKSAPPSTPPSSTTAPSKQEGYLSLGFRRTASVAASLKNLAFGGAMTDSSENSAPPSPTSKSRMPMTPRGRAPPEWTRPPEVNDHVAPATAYHQAPTPTSRGFEPRNPEVAPVIPLHSHFLAWSTEVIPPFTYTSLTYDEALEIYDDPILTLEKYFREPQMKPNEPDEPGSSDYNERLWRRGRNEKIISETQPLKGKAGTSRWDSSITLLSNSSQPLKMCFHQFEDHLAVADDRDTIA
jgi:regulator-associated protein of mTOR